MNPELQRLCEIGQLPARRIIGLMSGTSLDGLDIACCYISGSGLHTQIKVEHFTTIPYDQSTRLEIRKVFSKADGRLNDLSFLNKWIAELHAGFVNNTLKKWKVTKEDIHLIASHGQTVYHLPKHAATKGANNTLQIGDGDHLAAHTGIITISDFRQKHVAAGGEGAPLAVYGDLLMFAKAKDDSLLLNIGGIANLTLLPASKTGIVCTDTGPGNTLMDAWMQKYFGKTMDENGLIASSGKIIPELMQSLLEHPFFKEKSPKTCGQEIFNIGYVETALDQLNVTIAHEDILATLNYLTVKTISSVITQVAHRPYKLYISGGGLHNRLLINSLEAELGVEPEKEFPYRIPPDAKEAVLIALLGNETVAGNNSIWKFAGIQPAVNMGKISFPQ